MTSSVTQSTDERNNILIEYFNAVEENDKVRESIKEYRLSYKNLEKQYEDTERGIKAMQTVGMTVGEVLKKVSNGNYIMKSSQGPRYVVGVKKSVIIENNNEELKSGTRVALDVTTLTIIKKLPVEVDPVVYMMAQEDPGSVDFEKIGGLKEQVRELREVIELPLKNPDIYRRVGIDQPKGVLLYGPPGTGKTLLARALANTVDAHFIKVVSSAVIEKYIGESSRMIREMFNYARSKAPAIIFMDEIDAIGSKRSSDSSSSDREVQRTLMELLNQMDGFKELDGVKVIMATNRVDILDPALLRPGRIDRKIEIPLPNTAGRKEILEIYTNNMNLLEEIDYTNLSKLTNGFNGADLRHTCTEAGMFAIRDDRDGVKNCDFVKAARKIAATKKLESKLDYKKE
ncbi:26S protease regulatory subunit S10 [Spraguea lophii 42_110]|uniref:26S protease regulatory subunit S10 n=1 Tax=Spraguea lophii (strain 42_110) TaxID=1358809 RepID=S7W8X8_SPRLO|nr:26S protease regulatory subunit S10 [Spraguea lophii 42_110]